MAQDNVKKLVNLIERNEKELLDDWIKEQITAVTLRADLLDEAELKKQSAQFMSFFNKGCRGGNLENIDADAWSDARDFLEKLSTSRAQQGFTTSETATFVFSLKQPLFTRLQKEYDSDPSALVEMIWNTTTLLDKLGLYSIEINQEKREDIIAQQAKEILEVSTPIISVLDDVLALPIIGTLDSERTVQIMENLLNKIVEYEARVVIVDITGVPTVDTLTATHLMKTANAVRLLGARIILTGISPTVAQTLVELGVDLSELETKSRMVDGIKTALQYLDKKVIDIK